MRNDLPRWNGRLALQLSAAIAAAALMAGCSSDATRLSDPLSSPFHTSSNESAPRHVADAMPAGRTPPVSSRSLSAPVNVASAPLRPNLTRSAGMAPISHETTGSIGPAPIRSARGSSFGGWTSNGGVPVTVADGESSNVIAQRYGVPETALLQTNGLSSPSDIRPGASITIPVYNASAAAQATIVPGRVDSAKAALTKPPAERIAVAERRRDTRAKVAPMPAPEKIATRGEPPHPLRLPTAGRTETVASAASPTPANKAAPRKSVKTAAIQAPAAPPASVSPAPRAPTTSVVQATATPAPAAAPQAPVADAAGNPEFRWPARGRIIQGFNGGNDGINIALPDGTPVKAAEGGTVAYAGSELKGYGNLVLIRHPNGFVTAYANNGEIDVKRGDQVKRGQVIAKSGQSGNVSSPQLHFELRKGSTPVDPTTYLAGL